MRWLGTRVFVHGPQGEVGGCMVVQRKKQRVSPHPCLLDPSERREGKVSVSPGFPIHTPYVVLYAYRLFAFIHPSRESGAGRLSTTSWRYLPAGPRLWPQNNSRLHHSTTGETSATVLTNYSARESLPAI